MVFVPNDNWAIREDNWTIANEGQTYLLYMKNGGEAKVDLSGAKDKEFSVQWYNPRIGGGLMEGIPSTVNGGSENVNLGIPPDTPEQDWIVLIK